MTLAAIATVVLAAGATSTSRSRRSALSVSDKRGGEARDAKTA
jgi:hypothetical protein